MLVLAARGLSNRRIGEELHLPPVTAKRHLANIYQKIGVRSRNDAVRKAVVEQWIGIHEITSSAATGRGGSSGGLGPRRGPFVVSPRRTVLASSR